jgi:hypothetical protein
MRIRPTEVISVIVASIACLGAVASAYYTYANRNRELDIKLVEMGIGILRADPNEGQTRDVREWAIKIIETYSHESFSEQAKQRLLQNRLGFDSSDSGSRPGDCCELGDQGRFPRLVPLPQSK